MQEPKAIKRLSQPLSIRFLCSLFCLLIVGCSDISHSDTDVPIFVGEVFPAGKATEMTADQEAECTPQEVHLNDKFLDFLEEHSNKVVYADLILKDVQYPTYLPESEIRLAFLSCLSYVSLGIDKSNPYNYVSTTPVRSHIRGFYYVQDEVGYESMGRRTLVPVSFPVDKLNSVTEKAVQMWENVSAAENDP